MEEQTPSSVRLAVIFLSVLAGIGFVLFDGYFGIRQLPPNNSGPGSPASLEESRFVFDLCITFYGTVYPCGRILYTLLGRRAAAAELRSWSAGHLRLLNVIGGVWLLASSWHSFTKFGVLRPSALVAIVLIVQAAIDSRRYVRDKTSPKMFLLRAESWTRIWVIPFGNLLGIVLFAFMVLPLCLVAIVVGHYPYSSPMARLLGSVGPFTMIVAGVIDCRWRMLRADVRPLKRWLSPYEGATLVVAPIWLCSAAFLLLSLAPLFGHFR